MNSENNMNSENKNGLVGLRNRGNTCYLNTSIQCLSNVEPLTEYFLMNNHLRDLNNRFFELDKKKANEIILTNEYSKLIKAIWSSKWTPHGSSLEPKSFHEFIQHCDNRFEGNDQHDSQEVLSLILDNLHEGLKYDVDISYSGIAENNIDTLTIQSIHNLKKDLNDKYSIIVELFFGQFINKIIDQQDKHLISNKFEMFSMLTVPICGNTLYTSLDKYFDDEILETKHLDEKTNIYVDAYKQIRMTVVPKFLILVLKRYKNIYGHYVKSNLLIEFPIQNLDMSKYCEGYESSKCELKLLAIGCHQGNLMSGHYFSVCRHKNRKWYSYNDDNVNEFDIENHKNMLFRDGYILIYEKI